MIGPEFIQDDPPPPSTQGTRAELSDLRKQMDANPGIWFSMVRTTAGIASYYKNIGYESTSRKNGPDTVKVYLRRPEGWMP